MLEKANFIADRILLLGAEKSTQRLDLAFQPRTSDLELVTFRAGVFELLLEVIHLVNALLAVASSRHGVGFTLLNAGGLAEHSGVLGA